MKRLVSWVIPGLVCAALGLVPVLSQASPQDAVRAIETTFTTHYRAYARVMPKQVVSLRTSATGVIRSLSVLPGQAVKRGEKLATLAGPDYDAELNKARAACHAAQRNLSIAKHNFPHFSSASDVADARASLIEAQAQLHRLQAAGRVSAPCSGVVLAVRAANGERLAAGRTVVVIQPAAQLWLSAVFYGAAIQDIHPGMVGRFVPADGAAPIRVKVATKFAALTRDGGENVGLVAATSQPGWHNGEFGNVELMGPRRRGISVPSRALILDHGRWWVMTRSLHGLRRRQVVPGPSRGWMTLIEHGLTAGTRVVVENAWLDFHQGIAKKYIPPD